MIYSPSEQTWDAGSLVLDTLCVMGDVMSSGGARVVEVAFRGQTD